MLFDNLSAECHSAQYHSDNSQPAQCNCAECNVNIGILFNVFLLIVILLNDILPIVNFHSAIPLSVILLTIILLCVIRLSVILMDIILISVILLSVTLLTINYFAVCHSAECYSNG